MTSAELDQQLERAITACNASFDLLVACQEKLRGMIAEEKDYDAPAVKALVYATHETVRLSELIRRLCAIR